MVKRALICVVIFSLVLFSCSKKTTTNNYYSSPNQGAIVGIVSPPESHAQVTAYLGILIASTQIDADGYFKLTGLPVGTYSLFVQADGYNDYSSAANIRVTGEATAVMDTIFLTSIHDLILSVSPYDGAQEVSSNQIIQISFRREMDRKSVEMAFHITPEVEGDFYWYAWDRKSEFGSTGLRFTPRNRFLINTSYQVTIDTTASDTSGIKLFKPYQFSFTTESVKILYTYPNRNDTWVPPNITISIVFNTDMDMESTNSAFKMVDSQLQNVMGDFTWYNSRQMNFYPSSPLVAKETYIVIIDTTASDTKGARLSAPYEFSFATQPIRIESTTPGPKETWVDSNAIVWVLFNTDMDMESVDSAFKMVDSELNNVTGSFVWLYPSIMEFHPDPVLAADKTYTVTIDTMAKDMHGSHLDKTFSFWFKTRPY
jgi:hypothetical protein